MKLTLLVIATWLFCNIGIGSSINYPTSYFSTDEASFDTYQTFLNTLRGYLTYGPKSHEIPLLRSIRDFQTYNVFCQVELSYYDEIHDQKTAINLALYNLDSNIIAYKSESQSFFFEEAPSQAYYFLFTDTTKKFVEVSTSYDNLADRSKISLSTGALKQAISILYNFDGENINADFKESLVVVKQMVSEAAKFKLIQQHIEFNLTNGYIPKGDTISYEDSWDPLSEKIQLSGSDGKFITPVQVQNADYSLKNITSVEEIKSDIVFLLNIVPRETIGDATLSDI